MDKKEIIKRLNKCNENLIILSEYMTDNIKENPIYIIQSKLLLNEIKLNNNLIEKLLKEKEKENDI